MFKYSIILLLFIMPLTGMAETDTLKIMSADADFAPRNAFFEIKLNQNKGNLQNGTLKISTKDDSIGIVLNSKVMASDTIFTMQDSSRNALDRIYSLLGCQESDLNQKYYLSESLYGTIVFNHLINRVFHLPKHQLTIVIAPQFFVANEPPVFSSNTLWLIIGALTVIIFILIILYAMGKSKKPASSAKEIKDSIKSVKEQLSEQQKNLTEVEVIDFLKRKYDEYESLIHILKPAKEDLSIQQQNDLTEVKVIDILTQKYYDREKLTVEYNSLSKNLESIQQEYQYFLAKINTENEEEKKYFKSVLETYIVPFVLYFKDDTPYPADAETQEKLIGNLIPLAFHFMSFVKLKNKEGVEYDKLNMQQLLNPAFVSSLLKKVDFSANVTNTDNKLVLHIIELLKQYHVSELEKVNINGYIIKNDKSNA